MKYKSRLLKTCKECIVFVYEAQLIHNIDYIISKHPFIKKYAYIFHSQYNEYFHIFPHYHVYLNFGLKRLPLWVIQSWFGMNVSVNEVDKKCFIIDYFLHNCDLEPDYSLEDIKSNFDLK